MVSATNTMRDQPGSDAAGNVGQVVDWAHNPNEPAGAIVARYEYDPYGNRTNTPAAGEYDQPWRFSTKQFDAETGLGYWGFRYYDPRLGRWMSWDPIGEQGGLNLYDYCADEPSGHVDTLGANVVPDPAHDFGKVSLQDLNKKKVVRVCCRKTRISCCADKSFALVGLRHCWLDTSTTAAGMGPAGGGPIEQGGSSPCCNGTAITDHSKEPYAETKCTVVRGCKEDCINKQLAIGKTLGTWGPTNNCNTFVSDTLRNCNCTNYCKRWSLHWSTGLYECDEWAYDPGLPIPRYFKSH